MSAIRRVDPQGVTWVVRRRWSDRRVRWRGKRGSFDALDGADLAAAGSDLPVVGGVLLAIALVLFVVGAILFIVPLLILVVEVAIVVAIVGFGLLGRLLLGRPWTVEAQRSSDDAAYAWKVVGWGASEDLVRSVADQLEATGIPTGGEPVPSRDRR